MFRTISFYTRTIFSLMFTSFYMIKIYFLNKKGNDKLKEKYIYEKTSKWAKSILNYAGTTVNIIGEENIPSDKTILFVSNHQSNFDIPLIMSYIKVPKGFIAKKELENWPIVSTWMKYIHCVFMDRSNLRKSAEAIVQGIKTLKSGHSMVIFPEGTRSKANKIGEFKAGSFKLATKSKAVVVPLTIDGTYNILENNNGKIKKTNVTLTVHEPIDTSTLSKEDLDNLHNKVYDIIKRDLV